MERQRICQLLGCFLIGLLGPGVSLAQEPESSVDKPAPEAAHVVFNSSALQAGMSGTGLGTIALDNSTLGDAASSFGFAAKSEEANVFLAGALYSESLAFLRGDTTDLAIDRMEALQKQFVSLQVPSALYGLISRVTNLTKGRKYSQDALVEMLSLVQPFLEEHLRSRSEDFLTLFRAGSWLADLRMVAAAGRTDLLRQQVHLTYIVDEMKRLEAPAGVTDALNEIADAISKDEITARDANTVIEQVKRIQSLLG
jgi:hypothetical protein